MEIKMKKLLSIITIFTFFFLAFSYSNAENNGALGSSKGGDFRKVGAAGSQFLKIGIGARGSAMGAYSSVANDLSSIYWNPAGLADVKMMMADISYTQWIADFKHNYAALSMPVSKDFTLAAHLISFASDDIPITTIDNPTGTGASYTVEDLALGLTFAGYLTDQFSFGITAKYINNGISNLSASGLSFDIGTMYQTGIQGIKLGFAITNLGTEQKYQGQELKTYRKLYEQAYASPIDAEYLSWSYNIPIAFRAGISSEVYKEEEHKVIAAFDFVTLSDTPEQYTFGAEYTWKELLSLRAGYKFGHDQFGFSGGVGIKYYTGDMGGQIDYAISPSTDFGYVNRLSISFGIR